MKRWQQLPTCSNTYNLSVSIRMHTFFKTLLLVGLMVLSHPALRAQTAWPVLQSSMYPYIESMQLTRHEQTVLLGEGHQQTGIFYATLPEAYSEQVQTELISDGLMKNWRLHSVMRLGTSFVVTLTQDERILDIRLTNTVRGVDAVYSVLMNQRSNRNKSRDVTQAPLNKLSD
jgi:hypothetical protein